MQCARRGVPVRLLEMRPAKMTEAHQTGGVAELVCSNSLKSDEHENAHGLLKAELRVLGSVLLECAERARVPGGKALVVDRMRFSHEVQQALDSAGVEVLRGEVTSVQPQASSHTPRAEVRSLVLEAWGLRRDAPCVIATGPLTSQAMAESLRSFFGAAQLFFYDAIAPIVSAESLDTTRAFEGSRYGAGSDYLNCPMTEEAYDRFVKALLSAELHPLHEFEMPPGDLGHNSSSSTESGDVPRRSLAPQFFEGCLPVEEIARRGRLALAFGPMKPVGLVDPRGHDPKSQEDFGHAPRRPFAVVQLRRENAEGTMYNLVGFQTRLKQGEQERVFRMIPGLERAAFLRFGSIHRNTYLDAPKVLLPTLQARARPDLLVAGQLTGVEGYVESIGAGLVAGINAARLARGDEPVELPRETMLGSLLGYIALGHRLGTRPDPAAESVTSRAVPVVRFQPMNANFGLLPLLSAGSGHDPKSQSHFGHVPRLRGREKRRALGERALAAARGFVSTIPHDPA